MAAPKLTAKEGEFRIISWLIKDAETKEVNVGNGKTSKVCEFAVGYDDDTIVNCSKWGDNIDKFSQYLTKGKLVCVVGQPDFRAYINKDKEPKVGVNLKLTKVLLLSPRDPNAVAQEREQTSAEASVNSEGALF